MTPEKQELLSQRFRNITADITVTDAVPLAAMIAGDANLKSRVVGELVHYLRTEMSMAIVDH